MFYQFVAPERQKRAAASVKGIQFCKIRMFAAQIAPFYLVSCDAGVLRHT